MQDGNWSENAKKSTLEFSVDHFEKQEAQLSPRNRATCHSIIWGTPLLGVT